MFLDQWSMRIFSMLLRLFFSVSVDSEVAEAGVSPSACWDRRVVWQECLDVRLRLPEHKLTHWHGRTELFCFLCGINMFWLQFPSCKQKAQFCHGVSEFTFWWIYKQTMISGNDEMVEKPNELMKSGTKKIFINDCCVCLWADSITSRQEVTGHRPSEALWWEALF